ncbi:MAG: RsmE family RNA methyltransferase [Planctomycetota bacterium]
MKEEIKPRAPRFFSEQDLSAPEAGISREEAAHALKSRRLSSGARVELFDGKGSARVGILEKERSGLATVRFCEPVRRFERPLHLLCMAVSPPKGDRMTFLVEKLSELGADLVIPVLFHHSRDAGVKEDTAKVSRWRRTAIEAAKQCGRNHLLAVEPPCRFESLLLRMKEYDLKVLLQPDSESEPLSEQLRAAPEAPRRTLLMVGPEGGITRDESEKAQALGSITAGLSPLILRTETAALACATLFRAEWPCLLSERNPTSKP